MSVALLQGFAREYLAGLPVRVYVNKRSRGFEVVASATRRKYFYVAWLPAKATKRELAGAADALRDEITKRERIK